MQLDGQLLDVRCAAGLPAVLPFLRGAVAFREGEKAAAQRVRRQLQQHEEIPRPAGERGSRQELHGERPVRGGRGRRQLTRELAPRAGVVLQVMRLVEHQRRPRHAQELVDVPSEDVVVDHDPLGRRGGGRRPFDHEDGGIGRDDGDFARPVALDGGGTHDQTASAGREVPQRDDRLARFAEAHVVGEDRAPPPEQECDAVDLVREEPVGERDRAAEGRVRHPGPYQTLEGVPVDVTEIRRRARASLQGNARGRLRRKPRGR